MSNVIELKPPQKYRSGAAICRGCRHEWAAVTDGDGTDLECPACSSMKGTFRWPYGPAEDQLGYQRNCGCDDYFIMKRDHQSAAAVYCRNCGDEATGWFK